MKLYSRLRKLERPVGSLVVSLLALFAISACDGAPDDRGGDGNGESATITFRLMVESSAGDPSLPYDILVKWGGQPASGTNASSFAIPPQQYQGPKGPDGGYTVTHAPMAIPAGTWTLTAGTETENWSAQCEQTLAVGSMTNVNFTHGKSGCKIGVGFP